MYKYETHCHTAEGSKCGKLTGKELTNYYKELGYSGIFVTDHFFNGNTAVPKELSWEERVDIYMSGYENAKEEGDKIGLDVFFGIEFWDDATEFVIYGPDREFLLNHPDCDKLSMREFVALCHENGFFCVHAHPYRWRSYIKRIILYPDITDAVEVINSAHKGNGEEGWPEDDRALFYANSYRLPVTGASDCHVRDKERVGGIYTEKPIKCWQDYAELVRSFAVTPFRADNPFAAKKED